MERAVNCCCDAVCVALCALGVCTCAGGMLVATIACVAKQGSDLLAVGVYTPRLANEHACVRTVFCAEAVHATVEE